MGFEIVYGTDIWPHAVETFRKNFPEADVPDPIDILDIEIKDLPDVDVIIGGPPCTFSLHQITVGMAIPTKV